MRKMQLDEWAAGFFTARQNTVLVCLNKNTAHPKHLFCI